MFRIHRLYLHSNEPNCLVTLSSPNQSQSTLPQSGRSALVVSGLVSLSGSLVLDEDAQTDDLTSESDD